MRKWEIYKDVYIAPNPTTGLLSLSATDELNEAYQVTVRDVLGSQKMNTLVNKGSSQVDLDLSGFGNGFLLLLKYRIGNF